jgi:acetyl-CoA carboxylase biotin carboxyl carrier protein
MKGSRDKKTTRSAGLSVPGVDLEQVETLLEFMNAHGLEEFEYENKALHIRLKKASSGEPLSSFRPPRTSAYQKASSAQPATRSEASPERHSDVGADAASTSGTEAAATPADEELHIIKSPIVGTFYSAPSPEADSYVNQGDKIRTGQVVCIVEAMKLMNEIESDVAGEVVRVLVENKQPVEYGQPLFSIRADKKKK